MNTDDDDDDDGVKLCKRLLESEHAEERRRRVYVTPPPHPASLRRPASTLKSSTHPCLLLSELLQLSSHQRLKSVSIRFSDLCLRDFSLLLVCSHWFWFIHVSLSLLCLRVS